MLEVQIIDKNSDTNDGSLKFSRISVDKDYCKKWNIREEDFICLTKNGELVRPTLYRIGGLGRPKLGVDNYFMLLKHKEAFYPEHIMKMSKSKDPKHLKSVWCILDKYGNEKVAFEQFTNVYLVKGSCIYSIDKKYYNIETGEFYCEAYTNMNTEKFLFLDNQFDKDTTRRGVMKINKQDGSWELFPELEKQNSNGKTI